MSKQSPRWWKAWQRLAPRFIKSGRSNKLDPHLKVVLDDLERQGLACGPLQSWIPTGSQANALQVAQGEMGKLLNPYFKAHEKSLQRVRSLLGSQQVPKILIPIFEANYLHRRPAPYAGIAKTSSGGAGSGGSSGSSPARQKTTKGIKQVRIAQQRLERARLEMPSATDWGRDSDSFLICIDETWPQKGKHGSEGVIAGVVWQGSEPDFDRLPRAKDHRYASLAAYGILEQLFRCPQALPFIMPIRLDDRAGQASQHYDDLRGCPIRC